VLLEVILDPGVARVDRGDIFHALGQIPDFLILLLFQDHVPVPEKARVNAYDEKLRDPDIGARVDQQLHHPRQAHLPIRETDHAEKKGEHREFAPAQHRVQEHIQEEEVDALQVRDPRGQYVERKKRNGQQEALKVGKQGRNRLAYALYCRRQSRIGFFFTWKSFRFRWMPVTAWAIPSAKGVRA